MIMISLQPQVCIIHKTQIMYNIDPITQKCINWYRDILAPGHSVIGLAKCFGTCWFSASGCVSSL